MKSSKQRAFYGHLPRTPPLHYPNRSNDAEPNTISPGQPNVIRMTILSWETCELEPSIGSDTSNTITNEDSYRRPTTRGCPGGVGFPESTKQATPQDHPCMHTDWITRAVKTRGMRARQETVWFGMRRSAVGYVVSGRGGTHGGHIPRGYPLVIRDCFLDVVFSPAQPV